MELYDVMVSVLLFMSKLMIGIGILMYVYVLYDMLRYAVKVFKYKKR
jgi:hypothetical protein